MPAPLPNDARTLTAAGIALVTSADGHIGRVDRPASTPGSQPGPAEVPTDAEQHSGREGLGDDATGLYHRDRRLVSGLVLTVDGEPARLLGGSQTGPGRDRLTYGHWDGGPDPSAVIIRERAIAGGYRETITVRSFRRPVDVRLEVALRSGHATVYGLEHDQPTADSDRWLTDALWADGAAVEDHRVLAELHLEPRCELGFEWGLTIDQPTIDQRPAPTVRATDRRLIEAVEQAAFDLESLTLVEPRSGHHFIAAGAPHFLALFGRDSLLASMLAVVADPDRTIETVETLAAHQGSVEREDTVEAPGRILHELRIGDMGVFGLDPGVAYYGSVDATPLLVVVLAESLRWGADPERVRALLPAARAAIGWCRGHVDRHGFVHSIPHHGGITNQGWKDSGDSMVRADGSLVEDRTSLVEVQGYVHRALLDLAELEETLGDPAAAPGLLGEADDLADRFRRHFVLDDPTLIALAIDGEGEPLAVRASNAGHLLATDLLDDDLATRLADRLLDPDEFSGWGIRTLGRNEAAYHPLGYHLGTVWPHDNALILRGLARRGLDEHARTLAAALIDLAAAGGGQLPELLGGFDRAAFAAPVPYPASAKPQAWAAAVPFQVVTALLGLRPALHRNELTVRPILPAGQRLRLEGLRLSDRTLTIDAEGSSASVTGETAGLTIRSTA